MAGFSRFPHLEGSTSFPDVSTVDVYRYANTFDYTRWPENVELTLCCVPWCGDYENVVKFADDAARDAWFDSLDDTESVVLTSMRHIVPDQSIKLPFPIGAIQRYNYLMVKMPRFTSDADPVEHAGGAWKERYFYFVDNAVERAGNTTDCILRCDFWTTYINDLTFDYVMLARGHAPVAETSATAYLADPASNSTYLLAPDVNFGGAPMVRKSDAEIFNEDRDDLLFCIVTSASINLQWGTTSKPLVPASTMCEVQGVPGPHCYACAVDDADALISGIAANMPQFVMTVKCAFMVDASLVTKVASATVQGVTVWALASVQTSRALMDLSEDAFGYPDEAAGYAKLYTAPYAHIEVTDLSDGSVREIPIETLSTSVLSMRTAVNLVYPWISIDCSIMGAGGDALTGSFANLSESRYTWTSQGRIGDTTLRLDIPLFSISQPASVYADYTSDYDRAQAKLAADNALASALASNATARDNAVRSADAVQDTANNSADAIVADNAENVAANTNITDYTTDTNTQIQALANQKVDADATSDINASYAVTEGENLMVALTAAHNQAQAAGSAVGAVLSASPDMAATVAGAAASIAYTGMSSTVSQSNNDYMRSVAETNTREKELHAVQFASAATVGNNNVQTYNTQQRNAASTAIAANDAATMRENAATIRNAQVSNANDTKSTADANANRTYDTAISAIQARLDQAGVAAPLEFGERANGRACSTRPLGVAVQIVTQPDGSIMQAASQFARYGYALNQQWRMTDMQVMRHFTYWECTEVWCAGTGNAIEVAQQAVKDIMGRGVTVWSIPEDIGRVSVYDN